MTTSYTNSSINVAAPNNRVVLTAAQEPWIGVQYTIGEVSFPDENEPIMSFEYDIISGVVEDRPAFEKYVGDSLVEMIIAGLEDSSVVFKGGV